MSKMTDKNTKAQILDAYNQLLTQIKTQNSAIHDPAAEVKAKKTNETLASAATTVGQSVEDQIAELQKSMQSVLVNLSGSFADKVTEYKTVEEAIAIKKAELKEIHEIEAEAFSLAALINTKKELSDKFDAEAAEKRAAYVADLEAIRAEINESRANFQKEIAEEKAKLEKERKREKEEYEYSFNRDKQHKVDALNDQLSSARKKFEEEKAAEQKELDLTREELDEKEAEISIREEKLDELEAAVAALPAKEAQLKEEIEATIKAQYAKTEAIKENSIKSRFEVEKKVYENKIEMLEAQFKAEQQKSAELAVKLDAAYDKIQSMAIATTNRPVVEYRSQSENK